MIYHIWIYPIDIIVQSLALQMQIVRFYPCTIGHYAFIRHIPLLHLLLLTDLLSGLTIMATNKSNANESNSGLYKFNSLFDCVEHFLPYCRWNWIYAIKKFTNFSQRILYPCAFLGNILMRQHKENTVSMLLYVMHLQPFQQSHSASSLLNDYVSASLALTVLRNAFDKAESRKDKTIS